MSLKSGDQEISLRGQSYNAKVGRGRRRDVKMVGKGSDPIVEVEDLEIVDVQR